MKFGPISRRWLSSPLRQLPTAGIGTYFRRTWSLPSNTKTNGGNGCRRRNNHYDVKMVEARNGTGARKRHSSSAATSGAVS